MDISFALYRRPAPGLQVLTMSSRVASLDGTAHRDKIRRL